MQLHKGSWLAPTALAARNVVRPNPTHDINCCSDDAGDRGGLWGRDRVVRCVTFTESQKRREAERRREGQRHRETESEST